MKIEEKKDNDFHKPFLEINGFLYRAYDTLTELCAARLITTEGKSSLWHFYHVIDLQGNDLHLEYKNKDFHVSYSYFLAQKRIRFVEKVESTPYGLELSPISLPDSFDNIKNVFEWLFSLYEYEVFFDRDYWSILSAFHKALIICYMSIDRGCVESTTERIVEELLPMEQKERIPFVYSLLCYLLAGVSKNTEEKDYYSNEGYNAFFSVINGRHIMEDVDTVKMLAFFLPPCEHNLVTGESCDAYRNYGNKNKCLWMMQHQKNKKCSYSVSCPYVGGKKALRNQIEKHSEKEKKKTELPDLRDLILNLNIDDNAIILSQAETFERFEDAPKTRDNNESYNYLKNECEVKYLIHFTPIENVARIMKEGILPRTMQHIPGLYTDDSRLDNHLDASSFSISFPNYRMFYSKRRVTNMMYAVLLISIDVLRYIKSENIAYNSHNAASSDMTTVDFSSKTGLDAAKALFADSEDKIREKYRLPKNFTTNPQAELQIKARVPPSFIREIHVNEPEAFSKLIRQGIGDKTDLKWSEYYFGPRIDYGYWSDNDG